MQRQEFYLLLPWFSTAVVSGRKLCNINFVALIKLMSFLSQLSGQFALLCLIGARALSIIISICLVWLVESILWSCIGPVIALTTAKGLTSDN